MRSTVTARIEDRLQTISQQILSRTRLEQIVQDFNLYAKERADKELMEDIVEKMRTRDIGIDIIKGDAFRVSYQANDPRVAMRVTERLASLFIDESLRDREVLADGTNQFLSTQLDEARRQLVLNEAKLQEYQRLHNGELPSQMDANLQGQHNAEMALQTLGETPQPRSRAAPAARAPGDRHHRGAGRETGQRRRLRQVRRDGADAGRRTEARAAGAAGGRAEVEAGAPGRPQAAPRGGRARGARQGAGSSKARWRRGRRRRW